MSLQSSEMKNLLKVLLIVSVLVVLRAAYGFYLAFAAWDVDGAIGGVAARRFHVDPSIAMNFQKWAVYLAVSVATFLVLWILYRRETRSHAL